MCPEKRHKAMKMKRITVRAAWLELPVSGYVDGRRLTVYRNGELVDDITLRLDYKNPTGISYYPLDRWMGEELDFGTDPEIELEDRQTDEVKKSGRGEVFRPLLHFTPEYGWNNDPNGLVRYTSPVTGKTVWHMFYQFNPYDWDWGNMHWGHAVSPDLLHWTRLPAALYPDADGTMFSGSAVVDHGNLTGLKEGDEDVILLYYTCAGHTSVRSQKKLFTQCLAYSTDGGATFRKYAHNPVVEHIRSDNRDPKVIRCDELGKYVMAIYLDGNEYELLTSENLLDWTPLQTIVLEGDGECPDIYPLRANGDPKKRRWIISGASHRYLVGEFANGKFRATQGVRRLSWGSSSYAAQTYSTEDIYERIQIAWDRNMNFGDATFMGQMGIPCALSLTETDDGCVLCAEPIKALDGLRRDERSYENLALTPERPFILPLEESAYEICLSLDPARTAGAVCLELFGQTIRVDAETNTVGVRRESMPLCAFGGKPEIRVIADKGSAEIFSGGGRAIMTVPWMFDFNLPRAVLSAEGKTEIAKFSVRRLAL